MKRYCIYDGSLGTLLILPNRWIVVLHVTNTVHSFNMQPNNRITVNSKKCFSWMNAINLWNFIITFSIDGPKGILFFIESCWNEFPLILKYTNKTIADCSLVIATIEYNWILCKCFSVFVTAFLSIYAHKSAFLAPFYNLHSNFFNGLVFLFTGQSNLTNFPIPPVLAGLTLMAAFLFAIVCIIFGAIYRRQSNRWVFFLIRIKKESNKKTTDHIMGNVNQYIYEWKRRSCSCVEFND